MNGHGLHWPQQQSKSQKLALYMFIYNDNLDGWPLPVMIALMVEVIKISMVDGCHNDKIDDCDCWCVTGKDQSSKLAQQKNIYNETFDGRPSLVSITPTSKVTKLASNTHSSNRKLQDHASRAQFDSFQRSRCNILLCGKIQHGTSCWGPMDLKLNSVWGDLKAARVHWPQ